MFWERRGSAPRLTPPGSKSGSTATKKNVLRCRRLLAKRLAEGYPEKSIGAFDCSGLGMYWLENVKKLLPQDLNSNGMKGLCEPVSRDRLRRGAGFFILNDAGAPFMWALR